MTAVHRLMERQSSLSLCRQYLSPDVRCLKQVAEEKTYGKEILLKTSLEDSHVMSMTKNVSCLKLFLNSCTAIHPQQKVYSQNVKSQRYTVHFSTPDKLLETADTVYQIHTSIRKPQKSTLVRSKLNQSIPKV